MECTRLTRKISRILTVANITRPTVAVKRVYIDASFMYLMNYFSLNVAGDLSVIKNLDVLQKGSDKFLVYWEVTSVNYTQSISIETVNSNTTYNATLDKSNMHYLYSPKSLDPCAKNNVAVNVMACSVDCSGSETTSTYLIGEMH